MWTTRRLNNRCTTVVGHNRRESPGSGQLGLFMPNHLQLLFLGSFVLTFFSLLALSNYLLSKLREGGYDISDLILLGLPRSDEQTAHHSMSAPAPSFLDVHQSFVAQVLAILLAVGSSAFIYLKFGRSGTSLCSTYFVPSSPDPLATN
jgi:hypothetical protein